MAMTLGEWHKKNLTCVSCASVLLVPYSALGVQLLIEKAENILYRCGRAIPCVLMARNCNITFSYNGGFVKFLLPRAGRSSKGMG